MKKDVQIGSVSELAGKMKLYKDAEGPSPITFLIGAGCSVTAGIPAVVQIAKDLTVSTAKKFGAKGVDDPDEALGHLFGEGFFKGIAKGKPSREDTNWGTIYDALFKEVYSSPDDTRDVFKGIINGTDPKINWAHLALGELAKENWLGTTITTNFDLLALEGYARAGVFPVVSDGLESLDRIDPNPSHPQLIQINGSIHSYRLRNDESDLDDVQTSAAAITCFRSLFQSSRVFVIVGYAGREPQIMKLLKGAAEAYPDKHVFWCLYGDNPSDLSDNASEFLSHSKNARLLLGQAADTFFLELSKELKVHAPLAFRNPLKYLGEQLEGVFDPTDIRGLDRVEGEIQALRDELKRLEDCKKKKAKSNAKVQNPQASNEKGPESTVAKEAQRVFLEIRDDAANEKILFDELRRVQDEKYEYGRNKGDNDALELSIELAKIAVEQAENSHQRGSALNDLGISLETLGSRGTGTGTGTARLEEAVTAYKAALEEWTRDKAPLNWAAAQNNLGNSLGILGEREAGTARLEEAAKAYRAALKEQTRDKVPLDWAKSYNNLGDTLRVLGEREKGTEGLDEAAEAFKAALEEGTKDKVPLDWAMTRENIGRLELAYFSKTSDEARLETAMQHALAAQEVYQEAQAGFYVEQVARLIERIEELREGVVG